MMSLILCLDNSKYRKKHAVNRKYGVL